MIPWERKKKVLFNIAAANVELLHEYTPQHLNMATRTKYYKETEEKGKQERVNVEKGKCMGTKKTSPNGQAICAVSYFPQRAQLLKAMDELPS